MRGTASCQSPRNLLDVYPQDNRLCADVEIELSALVHGLKPSLHAFTVAPLTTTELFQRSDVSLTEASR
jgi:hypothetical protein